MRQQDLLGWLVKKMRGQVACPALVLPKKYTAVGHARLGRVGWVGRVAWSSLLHRLEGARSLTHGLDVLVGQLDGGPARSLTHR